MLAAGLLIAASPPGRFAWRVGRAAYHAARFQTGPALEALRLAWEQRPGDPLLRSQIAENLFVQGSSAIWDSTRREQALEELEEALQWEPSHLNARIFATQAALLLGELETAREHLEALDALAPDSFWAHCLRAELLAMEGDVAGAARTLQQTETLRQPYDRIAERFLEEARERLDAATRSAAAAGAAAGPGAELGAP
jgi:tetratricopeptide (TPR) repeat protein